MKIKEIVLDAVQQSAVVQPSVVTQQSRVAQVANRLAAGQQQKPPTELEVVLAMRRNSALKKRTDRAYAERLRQQLANADLAVR